MRHSPTQDPTAWVPEPLQALPARLPWDSAAQAGPSGLSWDPELALGRRPCNSSHCSRPCPPLLHLSLWLGCPQCLPFSPVPTARPSGGEGAPASIQTGTDVAFPLCCTSRLDWPWEAAWRGECLGAPGVVVSRGVEKLSGCSQAPAPLWASGICLGRDLQGCPQSGF